MKKLTVICFSVLLFLSLLSCAQQPVKKMKTGPGGIQILDYTEAEMHMGEKAMVCGKVLGTKEYPDFGVSVVSLGTPPETPGGFHVAIPQAAVGMHPKDLYMGKDICIAGMIEENPFGGATMTITSPAQFTDGDGNRL